MSGAGDDEDEPSEGADDDNGDHCFNGAIIAFDEGCSMCQRRQAREKAEQNCVC
jgi:hypothetical protein